MLINAYRLLGGNNGAAVLPKELGREETSGTVDDKLGVFDDDVLFSASAPERDHHGQNPAGPSVGRSPDAHLQQ